MNYVLLRRPWPDAWLEARIRRPLCPDAVCYHAVDSEGRTVAAAAFEQWTENAVGVHLAAERPMALRHARRLLDEALRLRKVVWCLVDMVSPSAILARKLGFVDSGTLPGGGTNGRNAALLVLTRERFENGRAHARRTTPAA